MTGKYNHQNYKGFGVLDQGERTFGNLMQEAGYATMIAGKWQLNGKSKKMDVPVRFGFEEYTLWQLTKGKNSAERYWDTLIEENGRVRQEDIVGRYGPDLFADYICDFIRRKREEEFFVYYPMVLPHIPFVPTPDSGEDLSKEEKFGDMVSYVDKIVGRIVAELKANGLLENTIVIFTGDNGTHSSITSQMGDASIRGGKGKPQLAGTHVPLVAYWSGHTPEGCVSGDLIDFTDLYPTLAEVAGVSLVNSQELDGRSFLPQLRGKPGKPRDWIFCHYAPGKGAYNQYECRYAQTERAKLYHDGRLYDLEADPLEEAEIEASREAGSEVSLESQGMLQEVLDSFPAWQPKDRGEKGKSIK